MEILPILPGVFYIFPQLTKQPMTIPFIWLNCKDSSMEGFAERVSYLLHKMKSTGFLPKPVHFCCWLNVAKSLFRDR